MTAYTFFNMGLSVAVMGGALLLARWRGTRVLGRPILVAVQVTVISYPWDYFAIHLKAWSYPRNPGVLLFGVPLNDLVFIALCSYLSATVLEAFVWCEPCGQSDSKSEHTSQ